MGGFKMMICKECKQGKHLDCGFQEKIGYKDSERKCRCNCNESEGFYDVI